MNKVVTSWAAPAPNKDLELFRHELPDLAPFEIVVAVTHCGLCASDVHLIDDDVPDSDYPRVCGHEVVGHVVQVGSGHTGKSIGQRVGIGWQKGACLTCEHCLKGDEQHCPDIQFTCCAGAFGGFSDLLRCDARFAYDIPEAMASEVAAPLLCAGHTTFTALKDNVKTGEHVGIVGIGGLGHLAIQYAAKMGCRVTALSRGNAKHDDALRYGASSVLDLQDKDALSTAQNSLDFLFVCAPAVDDWSVMFDLLRARGRLCIAGMVKSIDVDVLSMIDRTLSIVSANAGGRADMVDMFRFSQTHGITPEVEVFPMSEINLALKRLRSNKAKYRIVLENRKEG